MSDESKPSSFDALISLPECPVCHQGDRIEKASSVVRRNSGQAFIGDSLVSYRFTSSIAVDFAAPVAPSAPTWVSTILRILASFTVVGLIAAGYYVATEVGDLKVPGAVEIALVGATVWFGLLAPIKMAAETAYRRKTARHNLPAWREATARWDSLYYCVRDDVGFVKGSSDWRTPDRVHEILFPRTRTADEAAARKQSPDLALPNV